MTRQMILTYVVSYRDIIMIDAMHDYVSSTLRSSIDIISAHPHYATFDVTNNNTQYIGNEREHRRISQFPNPLWHLRLDQSEAKKLKLLYMHMIGQISMQFLSFFSLSFTRNLLLLRAMNWLSNKYYTHTTRLLIINNKDYFIHIHTFYHIHVLYSSRLI